MRDGGENPVKFESRRKGGRGGAEVFSAEELGKLRAAAGEDLPAFVLLRWTGLRGSDATDLRWREGDLEAREVNRVTQERKKLVIIPTPPELFFVLEAEHDRRPDPDGHVLQNPATGEAMTRPGLYRRVKALGVRAGAEDAHPHRFRDTLACDLLTRGCTAYDVAQVLGDTVQAIEMH
jgi:integrase/recombinase XerD